MTAISASSVSYDGEICCIDGFDASHHTNAFEHICLSKSSATPNGAFLLKETSFRDLVPNRDAAKRILYLPCFGVTITCRYLLEYLGDTILVSTLNVGGGTGGPTDGVGCGVDRGTAA